MKGKRESFFIEYIKPPHGKTASENIVDHIFCTGFKALKFETIDKVYQNITYISDHYPIIGKLEYVK